MNLSSDSSVVKESQNFNENLNDSLSKILKPNTDESPLALNDDPSSNTDIRKLFFAQSDRKQSEDDLDDQLKQPSKNPKPPDLRVLVDKSQEDYTAHFPRESQQSKKSPNSPTTVQLKRMKTTPNNIGGQSTKQAQLKLNVAKKT